MTVFANLSIVTGGASGIGKAVCDALMDVGAKVASVDIHKKESNSENLKYFSADISVPSQVDKLFNEIRSEFGEIPTGLVNCAGIVKDQWLLDMTEQQFDDVIRVNLKGTHLMCQCFARMLVNSEEGIPEFGGSIVNIASILGKVGNPYQSNYSASKAGVIGFTKSIAKELAEHNIRVNAILPGFIDTPMTVPFPDGYRARLMASIPFKRFGRPEEIADACVYLLSNKSTYITGSAMEVSGGVHT